MWSEYPSFCDPLARVQARVMFSPARIFEITEFSFGADSQKYSNFYQEPKNVLTGEKLELFFLLIFDLELFVCVSFRWNRSESRC